MYVIGIFVMRNNSLCSASATLLSTPLLDEFTFSNGSRLFQFSRHCSFQLLYERYKTQNHSIEPQKYKSLKILKML